MTAAKDRFAVVTRLAAERAKQGKTQQDVADASGLTLKTIGNYERGHTDPSLADTCRWARALGKTIQIGDPT